MKTFNLYHKVSILLTGLILFVVGVANATTYYSISSSYWTDRNTWSLTSGGSRVGSGVYPKAGDIVYIEGNHAVYLTANAACATVNIASGSTLTAGNNFTLTITGTTSVTGSLTLSSTSTATVQSFGILTVNSGGNFTITGNQTVNISGNLTVSSGGILNHNNSYDNATVYLQVNGDLNINGTYSYGAYLPAIWMNGSGTHYINTGATSVCKLLLRTGNFYANGTVTVDQDFYAMWNQVGGSFHTNGQTINANWGVVISGGTVYVDGGTLTVGNSVGGMLVGRTLTMDGDLQVSSGTLTISGGGIYLGTPSSASPKGTCTQSGGTINVAILDLGQNCTFTQSGGVNNVNGPLNLNYSSSTYSQTTGTPTLNVAGNLTNNGVLGTGTGTDLINIGGNWINNLTFTTSSTNTVTFNGSGTSNIGGSVSSVFNKLTINNPAGVTMSKDQTVNSTLTLTSGIFNIGSSNLILATAAVAVAGGPFSASNMIEADGTGTVRRNFSATGSYLFPIGDNTGTGEYSPITLNFTSGTFAGGAYAAVNVTDARHPNNASSTDYLTRYWTVSNSGITSPSFTATCKYVAADITGTEANIAGAKYTGSLPWVKYGVIGSNTLTTTAITNTGAGIIVTGISNLPPTVSITGGGVTICPGSTTASLSSTAVNATGSISYSWTPTTGLSSSTISNPVANPASTTTYTLTVTDGDGFTGTAMTTITVGSIPAAPTISAGGPLTFCAGGSVTLTSSAGTTYLWSTGATTSSIGPTTSGSYTVQMTNASGCQSAPSAATVVTVTANNTAGAPSSTPTLCINTALTSITIATTGATAISNDNVAGANGLPAGVKAHWVGNVITVSGTPTASGTFSYSIPLTGGCGSINATGTITVTANNTAAAPSSTPTLCINTPLSSITIATTGAIAISNDNVAGADGLPAGVKAHWVGNVITISGTPTASGTFSYSIPLTGGCGSINATGTITVTANNTAGAPSSTPTLCINTALTNITIATTGATAISNDNVAGANGLPAGVKAHWAANVITISGTPTASGTFSYSIPMTGGCGAINATGTITVTANNTAGAPSSAPTLCINTALSSITIATTGATAISNDNVAGANGLPAGVKAHWVGNVITISGTPTASGTFSYSIPMTGGCGSINATGTITVTANNTAGAPSSTPTLCINTALTSITIATTGATAIFSDGVAGANGLPAGVSAHWASNTITISGTPTASGTFNYNIPMTGGCGAVNATGTITINPVSVGGSVSGSAAVCSGSNSGTLTLSGQTGSVISWEYSTDAGSTWTTIVNTTTSQTYTNLIVATLYRAVVQSGVCASANSASASMTITSPPSASISYAGNPFCSNTGVATVTFSGSTGGTYSIAPAGGVINSVNGTVDLVTSAPGSYTVTYTIAAFGGCSTYTTTTSILINPNTWTGGTSTDWNTGSNWASNGTANTCPDFTILSGVPYQPILNSGTATVQNLFINSGAFATVTNATLQISGTINNSGTFDASNGTVEMNGTSAQTIPASAFQNNALYNLIISNSSVGGVNLAGPLDIYGSVNYSGTGEVLNTNDNLTFKSTATGTAWLGDMTGNTITGKATVERYLPSRKAWRFLSIPTNTTQTIRETWQEGAASTTSNPVPGYGIQLSGAGGTGAGFDLYSATPSMKTYNSATDTWVGVSGTGIGINATTGYMVFVRGDRTANAFNSPVTQTTLRTKGPVYTGNQAAITVNAGQFTAIGNPYPSTIDMRNITKTGVKDFFYVWDAALAGTYGYGAYQTFSNDGSGNYVITPGGGSYDFSGSTSNYIQSGQAFFVQGDTGGGSLTFKEGAKTTGSGVVSVAPPVPTPQLRANLYGVNTDNSTYIADGLLVNYDDNYSNKVDDMDAIKSTNTSENLSVKEANQLLVVERRHSITGLDTIFLNLTGVSVRKYRFEFLADQLYHPGLSAWLVDNYLHTSTPLYVDGTTDVDFSVTNTAASYAANRFMIVFSQLSTLPVTFTSVKAYSRDKNIEVQWTVENEMNMKQYETEKSADGSQFTQLSITAATANGGHSANYLVTDTHPVDGYNYYRVKSVDINGKAAYSSIVKVMIGAGTDKPQISVYPNPVVNGIINLQLNNQPQGTYGIRLLNKAGQTIRQKQIQHAGGSSTESIPLDKYLPKGIYQLEVTKPDGTNLNINVVY